MIVNMSDKATEQEIAHIIERIREAGYQPHVTRGVERTIVAAVGNGRRHEIEALLVAPGVEGVVAIAQPFKLVSRQVKPERTVVNVGGVGIPAADILYAGEIGGNVGGAFQFNVLLPSGLPSGNDAIAVNIGCVSTQSGVTVAVH